MPRALIRRALLLLALAPNRARRRTSRFTPRYNDVMDPAPNRTRTLALRPRAAAAAHKLQERRAARATFSLPLREAPPRRFAAAPKKPAARVAKKRRVRIALEQPRAPVESGVAFQAEEDAADKEWAEVKEGDKKMQPEEDWEEPKGKKRRGGGGSAAQAENEACRKARTRRLKVLGGGRRKVLEERRERRREKMGFGDDE